MRADRLRSAVSPLQLAGCVLFQTALVFAAASGCVGDGALYRGDHFNIDHGRSAGSDLRAFLPRDARVSAVVPDSGLDPGVDGVDGALGVPDAVADGGVGDRSPTTSPRQGAQGNEILWWDREVIFSGQRPTEPNPLPQSWRTPIDYLGGRIHFRMVIKDKPDRVPVWIELLFWSTTPGRVPHRRVACLPAARMTQPGTFTCAGAPPTVNVDLSKPLGGPIQHSAKEATANGGRTTTELSGSHVPLRVHYTGVLVPAGTNFSGWANYPLPSL